MALSQTPRAAARLSGGSWGVLRFRASSGTVAGARKLNCANNVDAICGPPGAATQLCRCARHGQYLPVYMALFRHDHRPCFRLAGQPKCAAHAELGLILMRDDTSTDVRLAVTRRLQIQVLACVTGKGGVGP